MQAGILRLEDISDRMGNILPWEHRKQLHLGSRYRIAYNAISVAIDLPGLQLRDRDSRCEVFMHKSPLVQNGKVWQFSIPRKDRKAQLRIEANAPEATRMLTLRGTCLYPTEMTAPTQGQLLQRVIAGLPRTSAKGSQQLTLIARMRDDMAITEAFMWKDGTDLFNTDTRHLRLIQNNAQA